MTPPLTGILIGNEELQAATFRPARAGWRLLAYATLPLSAEEREAPGLALKNLLKRLRPASDRPALSLPKDQAALHYVTLPSREPEELAGMARFEAERHLPFNAERHVVAHQLRQDRGVEGSEVLLAAADGPVLERVIAATRAAGILHDGISVSSACLVNALRECLGDRALERTLALASIGLTGTELIFLHDGRLLFSRTIPHGLRGLIRDWSAAQGGAGAEPDRPRLAAAGRMIDMMDLDKQYGPEGGEAAGGRRAAQAVHAWAQRLILELRRSYDFARREMRCPEVQAVILTGEGAILRNLEQYLYVNLNLEVEVLNPAAVMKAGPLKSLPFGGLELATVFGAAIQRRLKGAYRLDLTPDGHYRAIERRRTIRRFATTGTLALIVGGLGVAALSEMRRQRAFLVAQYVEATEQMRPRVSRLREEEKKLTILRAFLDDPTSALATLDAVGGYPMMGRRVAVKSITYVKGEQIDIDGHAMQIPDLNDFAEYLRGTRLFSSVEIREQSLRRELTNRPEIYVFRLICAIPRFEPGRRARPRPAEAAAIQPTVPAAGAPPAGRPLRPETRS